MPYDTPSRANANVGWSDKGLLSIWEGIDGRKKSRHILRFGLLTKCLGVPLLSDFPFLKDHQGIREPKCIV